MWSLDRRVFLVFAAAALTACGFTPAYGPGGGASTLMNRVAVDAPETRADYLLVQQLETRLGRAVAAPYRLDYDVALVEERMAITSNNITTRFNVVGGVSYRLMDVASELVLAQGRVDSFTGYSATGSTVATQAAQRDATERLMVILADQLTTRLIAAAPALPG